MSSPQPRSILAASSTKSTSSHVSFETPYQSEVLFPTEQTESDISPKKSLAELDREEEIRILAQSRRRKEEPQSFGQRVNGWWEDKVRGKGE